MKRSTKVLWIATVFSTIVAAAIAGAVVYFTAFRDSPNSSTSSGSESAGGGPNSESPSSSQPNSTPTVTPIVSSPPPTTLPPSTSLNFDHLSHSVPGYEYVQVDYDGDGYEMVQLDGSRSHTHYTEGDPIVQGRLVYMSWFDNSTRQQLATDAKPLLKFSVGTHVVGLTVMDNSRDSHTDYATVIVERPIFSGVYVYFYPPSSNSQEISLPDDISEGDRPTYARDVSTIDFEDDSAFPSVVRASEFQARCVFIVSGKTGTELSFSLVHYGAVRLIVDGQLVLESSEDGERTTDGSIALDEGDYNAQLLYFRSSSAAAKLVLRVTRSDGTEQDDDLQYDSSSVLPVLLTIEPITSTLEGGGYAKLQGVGLSNNVEIDFGGKLLPIDEKRSTEDAIFVAVPSSSQPQKVRVSARNNAGMSNALGFEYLTDGEPPIKFKESLMKMAPGAKGDFSVQLITGIKYGPDHRYYMSAIHSTVYSFATDNNMHVTDLCQTKALGKDRSILGLAFNPADSVGAAVDDDAFKLYVSASVLEWKEKERLSGPLAWANGQVLLLRKNVDGVCLGVVGDPIITGLPVTNHDHGVNGMVFDQDGKLHLQVGGFTNAGVLDETRLGGLDANPLSGASLVADVNKPGFDGAVVYDVANPREARQVSGDVSVYMSGLRNSFGIALHSNGMLYATDNGASVGFGAESLSCSEQEELVGENLYDELVRVVRGKYAGHPNRNRGRDDPRQCVFRGPDEPSDAAYEGPLATFESSTDGIMEYTADIFGGQLKGNLICTKYATQESEGKVFRVQLRDGTTDQLKSSPDELWSRSGLSVEMSPFGHLLMPRVFGKIVLVLTPDVRVPDTPSFVAVAPFRGPRRGGNRVMVTGANLVTGVVATFGGTPCSNVSQVSSDGRAFFCDVPPAKPGAPNGVPVALVFEDPRLNAASTGGVDYLYMNI